MQLLDLKDKIGKSSLADLGVSRPVFDASQLEKNVSKIMQAVKKKGDKALRKFTKDFDGVKIKKTLVTKKEFVQAEKSLSEELKQAILAAKNNIEKFHSFQFEKPVQVETMPGVRCWRKSTAIEKAGLYIPGGSAPLFSTVLMLGVPAKLAGCKEIILCTPPGKDGNIHPAVLFAAQAVGITQVFKAGGVQAIAAMSYGTETIPQVYKIFGPGNQYVTCAKQLAQKEGIAIDMPAGPSEVAVYADETAVPAFVAADLLSQAEHGADSQVILVTTNKTVADNVKTEIEKQLEELPRKEIARLALQNSKTIFIKDDEEAIQFLNEYAAEHLILSCKNADELAEKINNAGSVFVGNYSPESAGDYASGTNHTLPTNGYARAYSGVSLDSFMKKITFQKLSQEGIKNIGDIIIQMANAEGLQAHARAVEIRK